MNDLKKIAARFRRYVESRNDMIGLDPDIVHSLHMGTPHEASVTLTDLADAATALDALAAQAGEPVAEVIEAMLPVGGTWRKEMQPLARWLVKEPPPVGTRLYAAPPPAAPVSMAELEKALDDALGEAWRRGATGCHPAGEMVLRAHVLRLASAGVVPSVSRENLHAAFVDAIESAEKGGSMGYVESDKAIVESALRAIGITVKD